MDWVRNTKTDTELVLPKHDILSSACDGAKYSDQT